MMLKIRPGAAQRAALALRPAGGRPAAVGTLILAAVAAASAMLLSGCHAAPASRSSSAFAATSADKAAEARLAAGDTMPPVQPFDEHLGAELAAGE